MTQPARDEGGGPHWADGLTRHCHIDSHFGGFREVYRHFDPDRAAATIAAAGFQTATYFAKCWAGYSYYPTRVGVRHPGLDRDFTGDFTRALKEHGLRCLVYFNLGQERRLHRVHPEWVVNRDPDGGVPDPDSLGEVVTMCQRSPYLEECGIPQMLELVERYDVDGFFVDIFMHQTLEGVCYCPGCAAAFRRHAGADLPRHDDDPTAFAYRAWANATFAEVIERTFRALAGRKPEALLLINWGYMARFPVNPPRFIRQLTWDTPVPKVGSFAWNFSFEARYLSSLRDVTWSVMNTRGNSWQEYSLRDPEALLQEAATTAAAGGGIYLADVGHPSGRLDPAVYELFGRVNRRGRQLEPCTRGSEPVEDVAVLHSAASVWSKAPLRPAPAWTPSPAYHSVCGAHKALVEGHVQTTLLNSESLPERLPAYRALLLADQRILSDGEVDAIGRFVERGGGLVAFAGTGTRDAANRPRRDFALADILGVRLEGMAPHATAYLRVPADAGIAGVPAMDVQVVGPSARVAAVQARTLLEYVAPYEGVADGTPPAAVDADGPGVTINACGQGLAVYCAVDLGAALHGEGTPVLRRLILWLLDQVHAPARRTIRVENAPVSVEVFYQRRGRLRFVHLVNYGCDKREVGTPQTQSLPAHRDIAVSVALDSAPAAVTEVPSGSPVPFEHADGQVRFAASLVDVHAAYCLET